MKKIELEIGVNKGESESESESRSEINLKNAKSWRDRKLNKRER